MRPFLQLVSLAIAVLLAYGAPAEAGFSCNWRGGVTDCGAENSQDLFARIEKAKALFESSSCEVTELSASSDGQSTWAGPNYSDLLEVVVAHQCRKADDPSAPLKQSSRARYGFSCPAKTYTYYESGFDYDASGKRMHWDSQGTSTPIPPRSVSETNNTLAKALYQAWCL